MRWVHCRKNVCLLFIDHVEDVSLQQLGLHWRCKSRRPDYCCVYTMDLSAHNWPSGRCSAYFVLCPAGYLIARLDCKRHIWSAYDDDHAHVSFVQDHFKADPLDDSFEDSVFLASNNNATSSQQLGEDMNEQVLRWKSTLIDFFFCRRDSVSSVCLLDFLIRSDESVQDSEEMAVNSMREMRRVVKASKICVDACRRHFQVCALCDSQTYWHAYHTK